jgi:VCBS repeat-containing protein
MENGAPEIDLNGEAEGTETRIKYVENSPATAIAPDALIFSDSEYFGGLSLIVEFQERITDDDQLQIVVDPFGKSAIVAIENNLYFRDVLIGSVSGGTDQSAPLRINFHGKVTTEVVQAVIRSVGYANYSLDPMEGERFVTFTLFDRGGPISRAVGAMIYVVPVDTPAIAEDDTVTTTEDAVGTGNLFEPNGPGNDHDPDTPRLSIAAVNGSAADVGRTVMLRSGALLTVHEDGTYRYDPNGQFDDLADNSSGATNSYAIDTFQYTLADGGTATVTVVVAGVAGHGDKLIGDEKGNRITGAALADVFLLGQGGDDVAFGGDGGDLIYFGKAFTPEDRVDGGDGRDVVVLQGDYKLTLGAASLTGIEALSLQTGANDRWGDTANNFYNYVITMDDGNVAAGHQLIVNGQSLREGEDFSFDGSAERDGKFLVYGGHGVDTLRGGDGNDIFFFEGERWGAHDRVDGGPGRDAVVISGPSGVNRLEFGEEAFAGIESISVNARFASDPGQRPSYELVLSNGNVAEGATLIVNGSSLADATQWLSVDGSAIKGGNLILFGGAGDDTLTGGAQADVIHGADGADSLTGGGGADLFQYRSTSESELRGADSLLDFESGSDLIDLSRIDADSQQEDDQAFRWIGADAFSGKGVASAGELRAVREGSAWYIEGDTDGNGDADFVIALILPAETELGPRDFLL